MSWEGTPPTSGQVHLLVVKTNKYAGNFEREMCAYMTGQVGECEVGIKIACEAFNIEHPEQSPWFEKLENLPDDHGCRRPVAILPGEDGKYTSVGMAFYEKPTDEELQELKARAYAFSEYSARPEYNHGFGEYVDDPIVIEGVVWCTYNVTVETNEEVL